MNLTSVIGMLAVDMLNIHTLRKLFDSFSAQKLRIDDLTQYVLIKVG